MHEIPPIMAESPFSLSSDPRGPEKKSSTAPRPPNPLARTIVHFDDRRVSLSTLVHRAGAFDGSRRNITGEFIVNPDDAIDKDVRQHKHTFGARHVSAEVSAKLHLRNTSGTTLHAPNPCAHTVVSSGEVA